jgi:predicted aspartyl protease
MVNQNDIDRNYLIVTCTLHDQANVIKSYTVIDCGANSYAFIDEDYAHYCHLPLHLLKLPKNLTIIDGRPFTSGVITHITLIRIAIHNH